MALVISPYTRRARRGQHQLQPDEHGADDRADAGSAADEPVRRLGHAHGELLRGGAEDALPTRPSKNQIPLDRLNPAVSQIKDSRQRHWAEVSLRLPLDEADEADEDTLNRILWHARRGRDDTYPAWAVADSEGDE